MVNHSGRSLVALAFLITSWFCQACAMDYVGLRSVTTTTSTWQTQTLTCSDGEPAVFLSSLGQGEAGSGVLLSATFPAPATFSFWCAGASDQTDVNAVRLIDAETGAVYLTQSPPRTHIAQFAAWDLTDVVGRLVQLELVDGDTGSSYAWLGFGRFSPQVVAAPRAGQPVPADWVESPYNAELVEIDGLPFLHGNWSVTTEGQNLRTEFPPLQAERVYIRAGLNSEDLTHPAWGGGDSRRNFFLGDQAGELVLHYVSGQTDLIPLVFGYTAWWHAPYGASPEPFRSDPSVRALLDTALCVANGLDAYARPSPAFYLRVDLRSEALTGIEHRDSAAKAGSIRIEGLTFEGVEDVGSLNPQHFSLLNGSGPPSAVQDWLEAHTIRSAEPYPATRAAAVQSLRKMFATVSGDISDTVLNETPPRVHPEGFPGPQVTFEGPPLATLLTRVYYENAEQLLGRIDDDTGMVHESELQADYFNGFGGWALDLGPFHDSAYTRFRGLFLLSNMGFEQKVNRAIEFFDRWLMYFPNSYPELQLGGEPVPGHATVVANNPHLYFDDLTKHGWPTRYTTRDFGNPENDGHGLLMLSRWRAWLKQGRTHEWVEDRWTAIDEAADYILWCFEHPELSFSENGLLYNESEGGLGQASMYCDYLCYLGLLAYAEMAETVGRSEKANSWNATADTMLTAMLTHYPTTIDPWGDVWDPAKNAAFIYTHSTLVPLVMGVDYYGYDVATDLSADILERTTRTYEMQLAQNEPAYAAPAGIGYGQCYITQAGLLLDRMAEAEQMVVWMGRLCFAPRLEYPYRVPEGAVIGDGGEIWRRWGDLGNLYQLNEVLYTIHLMLGVDDLDARNLMLLPRLPRDWERTEVEDWPVRTLSAGESTTIRIDTIFTREPETGAITYGLSSSAPIDSGRVRLGPFAADTRSLVVTHNQQAVPGATPFVSGDSVWVWVSFGEPGVTKHTFQAVPIR